MQTKENKMGVMPIDKLLISMSLPMMISMLVQALYNIVDSIFVSRINEYALRAVSLAFPIQSLMIAVAVGTAVGINAFLSRTLGEKDFEKANIIARNGIFIAIASYIGFAVIGALISRPFFSSQTEVLEVREYGVTYLTICCVAGKGIFLQTTFERLLQATGKTMYTMITQSTGAIINIILDPILIFGLDMGVQGAALATVISQGLSAAWVMKFLTGKKAILRLSKRAMHLEWKLVKEIIFLGTSGFVMSVTNGLVQIVCNATLQRDGGDIYVGIMTVINSVREIVTMPVTGLTAASQPVIGYNYGAGCYQRVKSAIRFTAVGCIVFTTVVWAVLFLEPRFFLQMFTKEPGILQYGVSAMRIYFCGIFMMALQFAGQSTAVALNRAKQAVFFSLFRKVIIVIPLTMLLPMIGNLGTDGVFWAEPISNVIGGTACFVTMLLTIWPKLREGSCCSQ